MLLQPKVLFFFTYLVSIGYTHFRGKERLKLLRQLFDHSSLMAPINALMYFFSAVPAAPYVDLERFPELQTLRDHWEIIRDEAIFLYQKGYISASEKQDDIGFNSFFRRGWKRFYLKWYQDPLPSAQLLCPRTLALIETIPTINAAMFALLPKNSFLFKHRDPYAGSLRYHLGLMTPNSENCRIYVDGEEYVWHDGKDVIFDETYIHHAENKTDTDRIILFCDIQRPLTNRAARLVNRFFSNTIMRAASSKNFPDEQVGVINRLFGTIYMIRIISKRIKSYNQRLYYVIKYLVFMALFYFIFLN